MSSLIRFLRASSSLVSPQVQRPVDGIVAAVESWPSPVLLRAQSGDHTIDTPDAAEFLRLFDAQVDAIARPSAGDRWPIK